MAKNFKFSIIIILNNKTHINESIDSIINQDIGFKDNVQLILVHNNALKESGEIASKYEEVLEIHGFIVLEEQNLVMFDIIVDFDADREKIKKEIYDKIKSKHSQFNYCMIDDYDISD